MRNLSWTFKFLFFGIVGAMILLVGFAFLTRPTPAGLPDVEATVQARRAETPLPTDDPNLIPVSQLEESGGAVGFVGGLLNGVFSLLRGLWNVFSFGGVGLQLCCCILIPLGALVALARESLHAP